MDESTISFGHPTTPVYGTPATLISKFIALLSLHPTFESVKIGLQQEKSFGSGNPVATPVVQTNTTATAGSVPEWAK